MKYAFGTVIGWFVVLITNLPSIAAISVSLPKVVAGLVG